MNAICLAIDRLHTGFLGTYGNSWISTPMFDRLACESFTFDQALIDSPDLAAVCRSYWQGLHAMCPGLSGQGRPSLPEMLRDRGVMSVLLTDEPTVGRHPLAVEFDELVEVDPPWEPQPGEDLASTHLAKCFAEAVGRLEGTEEPFLLWCHFGGLGTSWDAPSEFRARYWEEGDPEPPEGADVPDRLLEDNYDPDELLAAVQAYAGQVTLLDACLGGLLEQLADSPAGEQTLLVVTSPRGFPLGEHRRLGHADGALYGELVQVPLMIRMPDGVGAAARSQALVQPADLWATLLDAWGIDPLPASPTGASLLPLLREQGTIERDHVCSIGDAGQRAIRTPAWYLRQEGRPELFAKPDDRWEANDVAARCGEVVECLEEAAEQYRQAVAAGSTADLSPLADVLREGLE